MKFYIEKFPLLLSQTKPLSVNIDAIFCGCIYYERNGGTESLDGTIFENIAFWLEKACFVMAIYMSCYRIYGIKHGLISISSLSLIKLAATILRYSVREGSFGLG